MFHLTIKTHTRTQLNTRNVFLKSHSKCSLVSYMSFKDYQDMSPPSRKFHLMK